MDLKISKKLNTCIFVYTENDGYDDNILEPHMNVLAEMNQKEEIIINVFGYLPIAVLFYLLEVSVLCKGISMFFDIDEEAVQMINVEIQDRPNIKAELKKED
jgi:NADH/NAD ratio-sensing transcriptional regulator Rex